MYVYLIMYACILNYACIYILKYVFVVLIFYALALGNAYNQQWNREIIVNHAGIELTTFRLRRLRQLPVVQHFGSTPQRLYQKHNSNGGAEAALNNWQTVWDQQVLISMTAHLCHKRNIYDAA